MHVVFRGSFRMLDMEWGQVQEGVALAEGGVELGGIWGLAEENKDWASKFNYNIVHITYLLRSFVVTQYFVYARALR
jgi:hypothetical protein